MTTYGTPSSHVFYRKLTRRLPAHRPGRRLLALRRRRAPLPRRQRRGLRRQRGPRRAARSPTAIGAQARRLALRERHGVHPRSGRGAGRRDRRAVSRAISSWCIRSRAARRPSRRRSSSPGSTGSRPASPAKHKIVALSPGYHGNTLLALSASAREHYKTYFREWLVDVVRVPAPYSYRCECRGEPPLCPACSGEAVEAALVREGPDTVAAVIAEPVGGSSTGASVPPPNTGGGSARPATGTASCSIADEVLTGAGRTGTWSALEPYGVVPDLMTLGKGIAGGYVPLSRGGGAAAAGGRAGAGVWRAAPRADILPSSRRSAPRAWPRSDIFASTG